MVLGNMSWHGKDEKEEICECTNGSMVFWTSLAGSPAFGDII